MRAREISAAGDAFTIALRTAQGLPPKPSVEEQAQTARDAYVAGSIDVEQLDGALSAIYGLPGPPELVTAWRRFASQLRPAADRLRKVRR